METLFHKWFTIDGCLFLFGQHLEVDEAQQQLLKHTNPNWVHQLKLFWLCFRQLLLFTLFIISLCPHFVESVPVILLISLTRCSCQWVEFLGIWRALCVSVGRQRLWQPARTTCWAHVPSIEIIPNTCSYSTLAVSVAGKHHSR